MRSIWSRLALISIKFARLPAMYRFSSYCAQRAGFFGE